MSTTYTPIAPNIYKFGTTYRVRVSVNGKRKCAYFKSKKAAIEFRNKLKN